MEMPNQGLELWGGIECTINRINEKYYDQLDYCGFYKRNDDINKIADLGIKALRYPILWEKHQSAKDEHLSFGRAQIDLQKLHDYNITPIIGLVHHGSGPAFVNFFDGSFENGLAKYAEAVAKTFPDIKYYTPVNEPLTTARFCGLYGHWYPHKSDDYSFLKILLSECKATVLAMQAIRRINPEAQLVQTEDLGKTYGSYHLKNQARFENDRRWISIDLLCGKITPQHPMWNYLLNSGIDESDLYFFLKNKCAPDILGLNYYITSERFLDEDLEMYPRQTHGGNFQYNYADVEAIRIRNNVFKGPKALITEAWKTYSIPIAITEVHLHCHREDQIRWLNYIWEIAEDLKNEHVDIRAVTAWALLGSFGWNKLLTENSMDYEPGAFDVRTNPIRPLALVPVLQGIANNNTYQHPAFEGLGWWQRDIRVLYDNESHIPDYSSVSADIRRPILILGRSGTLGQAFARICEARNIAYQLLSRKEVDICNGETIENAIIKFNPWAVINATGYVRVDDAEHEFQKCFLSNTAGAVNLAEYCGRYKIQLLGFSSDLVFDGKKISPYVESDEVCPLNIYGQSKAKAETNVIKVFPQALMVRTSAFFSPWDKFNFLASVTNNLAHNKNFSAANDVFISPTYVPDLVNASLDLLIDQQAGIWHIANEGEISWADFATTVAKRMDLDTNLLLSKPASEMEFVARRPQYSVLKSEKGIKLPGLLDSLEKYFAEVNHFAPESILKRLKQS